MTIDWPLVRLHAQVIVFLMRVNSRLRDACATDPFSAMNSLLGPSTEAGEVCTCLPRGRNPLL